MKNQVNPGPPSSESWKMNGGGGYFQRIGMIASFAMGFAFCFFADRIILDNKFKSQNNHYYSSENCINVRGTNPHNII